MPSDLPRITLRLSEEENAKIRYIANENDRKLNDEMKRIVKEHIKKYEEEHGKLIYTEEGEVLMATKLKDEKSSESKIG